jgi:peptidoglycan/xylan/chitin deacetylase (PgdA/CDA1 family)
MQLIPASIAAGAVAAASGVFAWGAVAPESQLFGRTTRRTGDSATMALTFDDGPNPTVTPALLDLLDRHGVRATFFVIGEFVRAVPALAREISARGHVLGNHTQTHPRLAFCSLSRTTRELDQCADAIEAATGKKPDWMRPPFGLRSPILDGIARKRGSAGVVMWSASARDWKPQRAQSVIERLRRARGGDIVLLHDGDHRVLQGDRRHTLEAVAHWLPRWKDAGIRFVTLDELREQA